MICSLPSGKILPMVGWQAMPSPSIGNKPECAKSRAKNHRPCSWWFIALTTRCISNESSQKLSRFSRPCEGDRASPAQSFLLFRDVISPKLSSLAGYKTGSRVGRRWDGFANPAPQLRNSFRQQETNHEKDHRDIYADLFHF